MWLKSRMPVGGAIALGLILAGCAPAAQIPVPPSQSAPGAPQPAGPIPTASPAIQRAPTPTLGIPTPPPAPAASTSPSAVQRGGTLSLVFVSEPPHWDPYQSVKYIHLWDYIGDSLLNYEPKNGEPQPQLVESWEYVNPTTLVLHIRKSVRWHNLPPVNGRELVADDVVWSIQRLSRPGATYPWKGRFERIAKVEATDKYTVRLTLKSPFAPLLNYLRGSPFPYQPMLPREVEDKYGTDGFKDPEHAVGTGPFMTKSYTPSVGGAFVRNPDYWRSGLPYLNSLQVYVVPDEATLIAAYRAGKIDYGVDTVGGVDLPQKQNLERTKPNLGFTAIPSARPMGISMNLRKAPFDNVMLRKALFLATDRQEALTVNLGGGGHISGPISWKMFPGWTWTEDELLKREGYRPKNTPEGQADITEAQRIMRELGYGPNNPLVLQAEGCKCFPFINLTNMEVAKSDWKKIWVDVQGIKIFDQAQFFDQDATGNWSLRARAYVAGLEPDDQLYTRYYTGAGRNYIGLSDREIDRLLDQQRAELDGAKRKPIIREIQDKLWLHYPVIWLHVDELYSVRQPWVRNLEPTAWRLWGDTATVWVSGK